jgi:hypothetical protein
VEYTGHEVNVGPIERVEFAGTQTRERQHADKGAFARLGGGKNRPHLGLAERAAGDARLALTPRVRSEPLQRIALDQFALQGEEQYGFESAQSAVDRLARRAFGTHRLEVVGRVLPPDRPNLSQPTP